MQLSADTLRILDAFALRTRRSFFGIRQGVHRSQRRGHGVEFAEYRKYEIGDNPRAIDWGLFARSDKLYIKRYLEEENVSLFIVIDGSQSLTHPALREKWELACTLASCISYVALSHQDPVNIAVLGGRYSPTFWGGRAFGPLQHFLAEENNRLNEQRVTPTSLTEAARITATRTRFPGICVVISDFLYPVSEAATVLSAFTSRNMEVHALQVLGSSDTNPYPSEEAAQAVDSETGEEIPLALDEASREQYKTLLSKHTSELRHHCLSHQIQFASTSTSTRSAEETAIQTLSQMGLFV
jgi:uncharacterized protein (DUF58 family)